MGDTQQSTQPWGPPQPAGKLGQRQTDGPLLAWGSCGAAAGACAGGHVRSDSTRSAVSPSSEHGDSSTVFGVYGRNGNIGSRGAASTPKPLLSTSPDIPGTRQVNRYRDAGERSYPCMDRGGSGNQCCNPGLGSGLLGLSISVLGSRPPLGDEMTMSQNSLSLSSPSLHALFVAHMFIHLSDGRGQSPGRLCICGKRLKSKTAAQNLRSCGWQFLVCSLPGPWHLLILPHQLQQARQPCTLVHSGGDLHFQLCRV